MNSQEKEDRILLHKACNNKCPKSLTKIYCKYRVIIIDYLGKIGVEDIADDIYQLVFIRIYEGKCNYNSVSDVKWYLSKIAKNIMYEQLRSTNRKLYSPKQIRTLVTDNIQNCPHDALETSDIAQILDEAIANLSPKSRQAIELVYLQGKRRSQAAKELGCDYATICDRIKYGLKKLKEKLQILDQ